MTSSAVDRAALAAAYVDPSRVPRPRRGPLAGIRVADFCWMGVGALATRFLADFGAEVIKIEDRQRLDLTRRVPVYNGEPARPISQEDPEPDPDKSGLFNNYNRNKLGLTLNMRTKEGQELARRLIATSDVVSENFAPGVMERWGLTYERLNEIRPEVVYARMSGFGHSGPYEAYRSYGPVVQAVSGLSFISGLPGREPSGWGFSYMDNMAAYYGASAILLALYARNRSGRGTEIDMSAVEAGISLIGPLLLEVSANERITRGATFPMGNRLEHPSAAPHGVYRCRGEDRWIAIAVFSDGEWQALADAMGRPELAFEPCFESVAGRVQHQDELDGVIETWTAKHDAHQLTRLLQAAGVRAGAVQTSEDLSENDPQIRHRGTFFELHHPVVGSATFEGVPFKLASSGPDHWRSAPMLGEDNDYVYRMLLGLSEAEVQALAASGVL